MTESDESTDAPDAQNKSVWEKIVDGGKWAADVFKGHAGAENLKKRNR